MAEPQPKRRRWYQFSLRTLMLFMVVCAIPSAWVGSKLEATRREQVVVAEIEKLGGDVAYHDMIGPDWLARHFRKVGVVAFGGPFGNPTQTTDNDLKHLKELTSLKWLVLTNTPVTDAGLEHLTGLTHLRSLSLESTQFTDAGLEPLKGLTNLEDLWLTRTQVTDAGVEKLQKALPHCRIHHWPSPPEEIDSGGANPTPSHP